ncbi:MAG TPA: lasso peptide biosynthesis B2 protein [Longimicrobium sp.]|nr:lasso peptide biosynthesis B2 protein [Longimicrobium sp.]
MTRLAGAALTGAWSALRVPLWLRGRRWQELLVPPASSTGHPDPPRGVVRASYVGVRVLSAVPGLPWRNTCLYRSVAECLALRRYGVPAVVRIGVRAGQGTETPIVAHAWVVRDPAAEPPPPDRMNPFALRA